jgi:hypothetical protein
MKLRLILPLLAASPSLATAQELPSHHPQFNNIPILEPKLKASAQGNGIQTNALDAVQAFNRAKNGYGFEVVWGKIGVNLESNGRKWRLAPSIWADGVAVQSASLEKDPSAKNYALRAAAWHHAILVNSGVAQQDNAFHLDNGQWREVYEFPNLGLVDADLEEVFKLPLTESTFSMAVLARRVKDYLPLSNGQRTPELIRLDETLAKYARVSPQMAQQSTTQRAVVIGKIALFAIGNKAPCAKTWFDSFSQTSQAILMRTQGKGLLAFLQPAVESAMGNPIDLEARVTAAEAASPDIAVDIESEIARTLWFAHLPDAAKQWAAFAVKTGDTPTPSVQWAVALTAAENSDIQYENLQKCAFALHVTDQDKAMALGMLSALAGKRGNKTLELRALEEQIMVGGSPDLWLKYSEKARTAGRYGDAWNSNRIALAWQPDHRGTSLMALTGNNEPRDEDSPPPGSRDASRKVQTRLDGAFLLVKLGEGVAAHGEYDAMTAKDVDKTALLMHRRFLRAELKKTPDDVDLKYAFERISAALARD